MLWELDAVQTSLFEFSTAGRRGFTHADLIVRRVSNLTSADVKQLNRLRVTSVRRTLLDIAPLVRGDIFELAGESAIRRRLVTVKQLQALLTETGRTQSGRAALRRFLKHFPGVATESYLEVLVWQLLRESGLPLPERQYAIFEASGEMIGRADFAYPVQRIVIEADGYESHSKRPEFVRDRVRQNALVALGWAVYRVTWDDVVHRAHKVVDDISRLLESRKAEA